MTWLKRSDASPNVEAVPGMFSALKAAEGPGEFFRLKRSEWLIAMKAKGHDPELTAGGDLYITDTDPHDGPVCRRCWWQECWNFTKPEEIEVCTGDKLL